MQVVYMVHMIDALCGLRTPEEEVAQPTGVQRLALVCGVTAVHTAAVAVVVLLGAVQVREVCETQAEHHCETGEGVVIEGSVL